MKGLIREINRYRQMDTHGQPADLSLVLQILVIVAAYAFIGYRMRRKKW